MDLKQDAKLLFMRSLKAELDSKPFDFFVVKSESEVLEKTDKVIKETAKKLIKEITDRCTCNTCINLAYEIEQVKESFLKTN